jgi:hypothetical protein
LIQLFNIPPHYTLLHLKWYGADFKKGSDDYW